MHVYIHVHVNEKAALFCASVYGFCLHVPASGTKYCESLQHLISVLINAVANIHVIASREQQ